MTARWDEDEYDSREDCFCFLFQAPLPGIARASYVSTFSFLHLYCIYRGSIARALLRPMTAWAVITVGQMG